MNACIEVSSNLGPLHIIRLINYQNLCLDATIENDVEGKRTGRATQILHIDGCASQLFQELLLEI